MTARQTGARFRQRKLSVKQNLAIVREHEIEASILDDEAQRNIPKVETGVEKGEEIVSILSNNFRPSCRRKKILFFTSHDLP
jgi:enhancer of polycomb-like protein